MGAIASLMEAVISSMGAVVSSMGAFGSMGAVSLMGAMGSKGAIGMMEAIGLMGGANCRSWPGGLMMDDESKWMGRQILEAMERGAKDGLKGLA
jgi:hypothetical protein